MKNVVVKVTSVEHGAEVIQAFKDLGVETRTAKGSVVGWYYGLFNGCFDYRSNPYDSQVITLEELKAMKNPYPKVMWVWVNDEKFAIKREVIMEIEHKGIKGYVTRDGNDFYVYRNAKDIEEPIEMKTPIQELIEEFHKSPLMFAPALALIGNKRMLEKEKELMCLFAFDYNDEYCNNGKVPPVKEYFNEIFNTKEKW